MENNQLDEHWYLNLAWYRENSCSLYFLAQDYLCPKCHKKLKKETEAGEVIEAISGCCARKDGFFAPSAPILARIFQIFLANGNKPLSLEELKKELAERRGGNITISATVLRRLLKNDCYYGFRPVSQQEKGNRR